MDQLTRHKVALLLLLSFVLQMTTDHVEYMVSESEAVADSTLVPNSGDQHIFTFCQSGTRHSAYVLDQGSLGIASQKHLEHGYVAILRINILEAFLG